jgi:hypothetical protein
VSYQSYPKWLYHPTQDALIVPDEAAHKALGDGWVESPVAKPEPEPEKKHPPKKGK